MLVGEGEKRGVKGRSFEEEKCRGFKVINMLYFGLC